MEDEQYISFETAKLLKERGYRKAIDCYYTPEGVRFRSNPKYDWNNSAMFYSAPTQAALMSWLRREKGLFIKIDVIREASCWTAVVLDIFQDVKQWVVPTEATSYEDICEEAIKYCLNEIL